MEISILPSKDTSKTRTLHSISDIIEIMIGKERNETIEELFDPLLKKYIRL